MIDGGGGSSPKPRSVEHRVILFLQLCNPFFTELTFSSLHGAIFRTSDVDDLESGFYGRRDLTLLSRSKPHETESNEANVTAKPERSMMQSETNLGIGTSL